MEGKNSQIEAFNATINDIQIQIANPGEITKELLLRTKVQCLLLQKHIQQDMSTFSQYEVKRFNEKLNSLFIEINYKLNQVGKKVFVFTGDPIPRDRCITKANKANESNEVSGTNWVNTNSINKTANVHNTKITIVQQHSFVQNFSGCVIITNSPAEQLHLQNGTGSVIRCESNGPIFLENVANLIVIVKCHQLRLRRVKQCTIYGNIGNNTMVIEECANLVYAPLALGPTPPVIVDDFSNPTRAAATKSTAGVYKNVTIANLAGVPMELSLWIEAAGDDVSSGDMLANFIQKKVAG